MITKWLAILALAAVMTSQPVQPVADEPAPAKYQCLTDPVDWPHLPEWDICLVEPEPREWGGW